MKKIFISVLLLIVTVGIYAQSETEVLKTKRGVPIIPAVGDFAIGIDATPFFQFAGNLFSNSNPYYPSFGFTAQAPGSIFGKYKASATTTYRATLLIGYTSETIKEGNSTDPDVIDKMNASALSIGLSAGIEKHREIFGRLSGYFGAQAGVRNDPWAFYDNTEGRYYYGKFSFKDGNDSNNDYTESGGSKISVSAGGFLGVEFYIAPRIALAGEYGYYLNFYSQGKRVAKPASGTETIIDYGNGGFEAMPAASGNLVLLFYF
jgi:hypothetical protein